MGLGRHENFHFEQSPIIAFHGVGTTDGTTVPQTVVTLSAMIAINPENPAETSVFAEPEQTIRVSGNTGHVLDNLSRLIILAGRTAGTGTWSAGLQFFRESTLEKTVSFQVPLLDSSPVIVLDSPLPADFAKTGSALDDVINAALIVIPGEAAASTIYVVALLVPGFVASQSNKGANLSARQFLSFS